MNSLIKNGKGLHIRLHHEPQESLLHCFGDIDSVTNELQLFVDDNQQYDQMWKEQFDSNPHDLAFPVLAKIRKIIVYVVNTVGARAVAVHHWDLQDAVSVMVLIRHEGYGRVFWHKVVWSDITSQCLDHVKSSHGDARGSSCAVGSKQEPADVKQCGPDEKSRPGGSGKHKQEPPNKRQKCGTDETGGAHAANNSSDTKHSHFAAEDWLPIPPPQVIARCMELGEVVAKRESDRCAEMQRLEKLQAVAIQTSSAGEGERIEELGKEIENLSKPVTATLDVKAEPGCDGAPQCHCQWCHATPVDQAHQEQCAKTYEDRMAKHRQNVDAALRRLRLGRSNWHNSCSYHQQLIAQFTSDKGPPVWRAHYKNCKCVAGNGTQECWSGGWEELHCTELRTMEFVHPSRKQMHIKVRNERRTTIKNEEMEAKSRRETELKVVGDLDKMKQHAFKFFGEAVGHPDHDKSFGEDSPLLKHLNNYLVNIKKCDIAAAKGKHEIECNQMIVLIGKVSEMRKQVQKDAETRARTATEKRIRAIKEHAEQLRLKGEEQKLVVETAVRKAAEADQKGSIAWNQAAAAIERAEKQVAKADREQSIATKKAATASEQMQISSRCMKDLIQENNRLRTEKCRHRRAEEDLHLQMFFRSFCDDAHTHYTLAESGQTVKDALQTLAKVPTGWKWLDIAHNKQVEAEWVEKITKLETMVEEETDRKVNHKHHFNVFELLRFIGNATRHHDGTLCEWLLDNLAGAYALLGKIVQGILSDNSSLPFFIMERDFWNSHNADRFLDILRGRGLLE